MAGLDVMKGELDGEASPDCGDQERSETECLPCGGSACPDRVDGGSCPLRAWKRLGCADVIGV